MSLCVLVFKCLLFLWLIKVKRQQNVVLETHLNNMQPFNAILVIYSCQNKMYYFLNDSMLKPCSITEGKYMRMKLYIKQFCAHEYLTSPYFSFVRGTLQRTRRLRSSNCSIMARRDSRVYVGNLPPDIRTRDIEDLFYRFGKIVFVDLKNRKGPPFAFVEFEDPR